MHKILKKYYIAMAIFLLPSILVVYSCNTTTNYELLTPGGFSKVEDRFVVEGGNEAGDFYSLYVYVVQNATPFQNFIAQFLDLADVSLISNNYSHMTDELWYEAGVIQKQQSEEASIINAYEAASIIDPSISIVYDYVGAIVRLTTTDTNILEIGDIITHVNDIAVTSKNQFYDDEGYSLQFPAGAKLTIIRNDEVLDIVVKEDDVTRAAYYDKFNIYDNNGKVNATPSIKINPTASTGPSAGMMQTLSIYNQLVEEDITIKDGKKINIIGTGTIETDGSIGRIGGVGQKVYSAYSCGADVMFVSQGDYADAKASYDSLGIKESEMMLVGFNTFSEVLEWLS